jgi:hypothetical protein
MPPKEEKSLSHVLTIFNATELGQGDPIAGFNLLAGMALTLSNLARPGSGIRTPEGRLIPVGCSLLVSGASSTSQILNETIVPVGRHQTNLLAHLERLLKRNFQPF